MAKIVIKTLRLYKVGYDDIDSISIKAQYIMDNKLAGAMFWSIDSDDFKGNHCDQGKYPLVNSVKKVFESMSSVSDENNEIETTSTTSTTTATTTTTTTSTTTTTTTTTTTSTTTTSLPELLDYFDEDTNNSATINAKIEPPTTVKIVEPEQPKKALSDDDKELLVKNILSLEEEEPIKSVSLNNMDKLNEIMNKINLKTAETLRKLKSKIESKQRIFKLSNTSINKKLTTETTTSTTTTTSQKPEPTTTAILKQTLINPLQQLSQIQQAQLLTNMFRFSMPNKIVNNKIPKQSTVQDRIDQAYRNGFNDSYTCMFDGLYGDKSSGCVIFYECVWTNTRYAKKQLRVCPESTIFNQNINVCDWEFNTVC